MKFAFLLILLIALVAEPSPIPLETDFDADTWGEVFIPFAENHIPCELKLNSEGVACILCEYTIGGSEPEFICYTEYNGSEWFYEILAEDQIGSCMDLTSDDKPVILAFDIESEELRLYTFQPDSSWSITVVDSFPGEIISSIAMCLDSQDYPHIAVNPPGKMDMLYYHYDGVSWTVNEFYSGGSPEIAVNSNDEPWIVFNSLGEIYCHWYELGSWWYEQLTSSGGWSHANDFCFDNNNRALISYNHALQSLRHKWDAGSAWLNVSITGTTAIGADMFVGNDDLSYVAFRKYDFDDLWLATGSDSIWSIQQVAWEGDVGYNIHLGVDDSGKRFITFTECDSLKNHSMRLMIHQEWTQIEESHSSGDELQLNLALFPCPSRGFFTADCSVPIGMDASLDVYDISGKKLKSIQVFLNGETLVPVNDLPSGLYSVVLSSGGSVTSRQIAVIH